MNYSASVSKLAKILSWLIAAILVLVPFHAFATVWLSSLVGHYTLLRLWKEFLLVIILAGSLFILIKDKQLRQKMLSLWLVRLIIVYVLVMLIWGFVALARHDVNGKAMWYGELVNLRFLIFFLAVWVVAAKSSLLPSSWLKILLGPGILVAAFAILQYLVLPYDFLKHFGYGASTIAPYETINNSIQHIRVESTLRGANPLGAYLVLPLSVLAVLFFKEKSRKLDKSMIGLGLALALLFSFSRSAWIGAAASLILVGWVSLKSWQAKRTVLLILTILVIIGAFAAVILRNNSTFDNTFLHTDRSSKALMSSNQGHNAAFKSAVKDIVHQPWGGGVGTAGPESVYNNHPGRIAENYFLQIGQETGLLGMALFIAICAGAGQLLCRHRDNPLALSLLASLIGLSLVNFLSHAWTDDTLAYIWWGLAGIALAPAILKPRKQDGPLRLQKT